MLYLLLADGRIEKIAEASCAHISELDESLVCYNEYGEVVARYSRLAVTVFSRTPLPVSYQANSTLGIQDHANRLKNLRGLVEVFEEVLDSALKILGTDRGDLQLYDPNQDGLVMVAQRGFEASLLRDYKLVRTADGTPCGTALARRQRVILEDVNEDLAFLPHAAVAKAAGLVAMQSTPLIRRDGRMLGILSTHYGRRHRPTEEELDLLDAYLSHAVPVIERELERENAFD